MGIGFFPEAGWQSWAAGAVIALATALLIAAWRRPGALGRRRGKRIWVAALTWLAALLFSAALCAPGIRHRASGGQFSVVVLLDVSDSMLRTDGGWASLRLAFVERLRGAFREHTNRSALARVVTFRGEASAFDDRAPLGSIADEVAKIAPSSFAPGAGTNIAAGLIRAGDLIDRSGGRGAVVLFSDGNETEGDAAQAALELGRKGIPVYIAPFAGGRPELAIMEANLPPNVSAGVETYVRGMALNAGDKPVQAELAVGPRVLSGDQGPADATPQARRAEISLAPQVWSRFRTPIVFENPGLQFVDVTLSDKLGSLHRRRLFTFVESPPRLLAVGDDRWREAFPAGSALIARRPPRDVSAEEALEKYDGFVIDGVPAGDFAPGTLAAMAKAVRNRGAGLFLMNGRHLGSPRDATNIMSYNYTPMEELLPLVSRPRPKEADPPPRHVVILIDASGSMVGAPLEMEQRIATYLVEKMLRAKDSLDVCAFTDTASQIVTNQPMTEEGKSRASASIRSIEAGGGTDPSECLRSLSARKLPNCGLVFLSDGYFEKLAVQRPDCRTTAFGIGRSSFAPNDPLRDLADPIPVGPNFDPARIKIPYFDKRPEDQYYEPGAYTPLSMSSLLDRGNATEVPAIPLNGSADSYPKDDAEVMAVRPKLTDPVLAYKESATGNAGEFTTTLPPEWVAHEDGRRAIREWITRVLPMSDQRRYLFQLVQTGGELQLEISLTPRAGRLPRVEHLDVTLEVEGVSTSVAVRPDEAVPDLFRGRFRPPWSQRPVPAALILRESGPDALPRPQRVPILAPTPEETETEVSRESYTYGLNEALLRRIADAGGGAYDALEQVGSFAAPAGESRSEPIWPALAAAGCLCYLLAVLLRRLDI